MPTDSSAAPDYSLPCAYCKNGFCRLKKCKCKYSRSCSDRLKPVSLAQHAHIQAWQETLEDLSTKKKRFAFHTRDVDRYTVFRTCKCKRRFRSAKKALEMARHIYQRKGVLLAIYECPFCGGYHLTHQVRPSLPRPRVRSAEGVA